MAKQHAAYTTSISTDPGDFLTGFTTGGVPYIGMGGSLDKALALYAAAVAVTSSEQMAGSLIEQASRVAGGGREQTRLAMEKSQNVSWNDLSHDQRVAAMLAHVKSIPQNIRCQTLSDQGFPEELTNKINMLVLDRATETYEETLKAVTTATPDTVQRQSDAYLKSMLGKDRDLQGTTALRTIQRGPDFANWQRRLTDARSKFDDLLSIGQDRWIFDSLEPYVIAFEGMEQQLRTSDGKPPRSGPARELWFEIQQELNLMREWDSIFYTPGRAAKWGYKLSQRLDAQLKLQDHTESPPPNR